MCLLVRGVSPTFPSPLSPKRVLVIHLHILRGRRWTIVIRVVGQVRSNQPFLSCSPTGHFFPPASRGRFMDTLFLSLSIISLPPSPSSSLLFPQHPYLRVDLQKNSRNQSFTRWHNTDHSGIDSLQAAGVIWSTRPGPLRSQPHAGHSQMPWMCVFEFTHRPFCRYL